MNEALYTRGYVNERIRPDDTTALQFDLPDGFVPQPDRSAVPRSTQTDFRTFTMEPLLEPVIASPITDVVPSIDQALADPSISSPTVLTADVEDFRAAVRNIDRSSDSSAQELLESIDRRLEVVALEEEGIREYKELLMLEKEVAAKRLHFEQKYSN